MVGAVYADWAGWDMVNTNPALAMENTSIAAIPNSNVWCDADWTGEVGVPDWISVQSAAKGGDQSWSLA